MSTKVSFGTFVTLVVTFVFISCNYQKKQMASMAIERDSLVSALSERDDAIQEMNDFVEIIASSLDSIKKAEGLYTLTRTPEGVYLKKDEILNNLDLLENVIRRQRERIGDLENMLKESRDSTNSYIVLIKHLYAQIEEKDAQIKQMKKDLDSKNKQISTLKAKVNTIQKNLDEADKMIDAQNDLLKGTDKILNTGYILAASKKELQSMGILSKRLLSQKVNYANIDTSRFDEVDMREFQEITFESSFKVLSTMPDDSYEVIRNGSSYILKVTDPGKFWSLTQYLIVQL